MSTETIRFDNLLTEIKCAFHAGNFANAELMAAELHTMARTARKVSELVIVPTTNKTTPVCAGVNYRAESA